MKKMNWNDKEMIFSLIKEEEKIQCFDDNPPSQMYSYRKISDELKNSKAFNLELVKLNPSDLEEMKDEFKSDEDIVLEAIRRKPYIYHYANWALFENKEFVKKLVEANPEIMDYDHFYKWVPEEIKLSVKKEEIIEQPEFSEETLKALDILAELGIE